MGTAIDIANLASIKDRFSFAGKKGFVTGGATHHKCKYDNRIKIN